LYSIRLTPPQPHDRGGVYLVRGKEVSYKRKIQILPIIINQLYINIYQE
jgi:hypothetical protein